MTAVEDFTVPLSVADLLEITKTLRRWERRLFDRDGSYTELAGNVSRIEIERPDDPGCIIGHIVLEDGWAGFRPIQATK